MTVSGPDLPVPALRNQAVLGAMWTGGQKWYGRVLSVITFIILGRLLSPGDFGLIAVAGVIAAFASTLVDLGFGTYLVQSRDVEPRTTNSVFWPSLAVGLFLSAAQIVCAPLIAEAFDSPRLVPVISVTAVLYPLAALSAVPIALLRRELMFRSLALRSMISLTAGSVVAVTLAVRGFGVWSLVGQSLAASIVGVVVLLLATRWHPSFNFNRAEFRTASRYGSSVFGVQFLHTAWSQSDAFIVGIVLGPIPLGFYAVAGRIVNVAQDVTTSVVGSVAMPVFAKIKSDRARVAVNYSRAIRLNATLVSPILILLLVVTPVMIPLLFGWKWQPAVAPALWLTLAALISSNTWFDRQVLYALGYPRVELVFMVFVFALSIALFVVAAIQWGITGVAAAMAARVALTWPIRMAIMHRLVGIEYTPLWKQVSRVWLAGLVAGMAAYCCLQVPARDFLAMLLASTVFLLLYILFVRVFAPQPVGELAGLLPQRLRARLGGRLARWLLEANGHPERR